MRVFDRRWRVTVMAIRSKRWRVRDKMEGDRAGQRVTGFILCLRKTKEKKTKGFWDKKLKTQVLWLRVLNAA